MQRESEEGFGSQFIPVAIIEEQRLFAPFITQVLSQAGFIVVTMVDSISIAEIERNEPRVIFIDTDFISNADPIAAIQHLRTVLPSSTICSYTGTITENWALACRRAGANCVISKSASSAEIVEGILSALRVGSFVDRRFTNA